MPLNISTRLICVATLPCKMSEIALKPATTLIYCVINVDQAWPVAHKQPGLESGRLWCLGVFNRWFISGLFEFEDTTKNVLKSVKALSILLVSKSRKQVSQQIHLLASTSSFPLPYLHFPPLQICTCIFRRPGSTCAKLGCRICMEYGYLHRDHMQR